VKLLQDKGFEDSKDLNTRSDETPLNAKPYPLGKCPILKEYRAKHPEK
jgi:hypothetical protein